MDIRTAICDDELTDREVVSQYLTRWAKEHGHTITLSMFSSAESFLFNFEDKPLQKGCYKQRGIYDDVKARYQCRRIL